MSELKQIRKVEKWEARDGTFHDSLEAAQTYQLMRDLKDALGACKGREEDQARHLLSHFNIVRKGDTPKGAFIAPATVEHRKAPKTVCTNCYLIVGGAIGSILTWILCGAVLFR